MGLDLGALARKLLVNPIKAVGHAIGDDYKNTVYGPDWKERSAARSRLQLLKEEEGRAAIRRSDASARADEANSGYQAALLGAQTEKNRLERAGLEAAAKRAGLSVEEFLGKQIIDKEARAQAESESLVALRPTIQALNEARAMQAEAAAHRPAGGSGSKSEGQFDKIVLPDGTPGYYYPRTGRTVRAPDGAQPKPSATETDRRTALTTMLQNAQYLGQLVDKVPETTFGPISGRLSGAMTEYVGVDDPSVSDLQTISDDMADMLLRARSGAQINEQEYARLRPLVPNYRTPKSTFKARLANFQKQLAMTLSARMHGGTQPVDDGGGAPTAPGPSRFKIETVP